MAFGVEVAFGVACRGSGKCRVFLLGRTRFLACASAARMERTVLQTDCPAEPGVKLDRLDSVGDSCIPFPVFTSEFCEWNRLLVLDAYVPSDREADVCRFFHSRGDIPV